MRGWTAISATKTTAAPLGHENKHQLTQMSSFSSSNSSSSITRTRTRTRQLGQHLLHGQPVFSHLGNIISGAQKQHRLVHAQKCHKRVGRSRCTNTDVRSDLHSIFGKRERHLLFHKQKVDCFGFKMFSQNICKQQSRWHNAH